MDAPRPCEREAPPSGLQTYRHSFASTHVLILIRAPAAECTGAPFRTGEDARCFTAIRYGTPFGTDIVRSGLNGRHRGFWLLQGCLIGVGHLGRIECRKRRERQMR